MTATQALKVTPRKHLPTTGFFTRKPHKISVPHQKVVDSSSSLEDKGTSRVATTGCTYGQVSRSRDVREWKAVVALYRTLDPDPDGKSLNLLLNCHNRAYYCRHEDTGEVRIMSNHCTLRWCPICARGKAALVATNMLPWVEHAEAPKLLTLTIAHSSAPLAEQLNTLTRNFRRLLARKFFKLAWRGGIAFIQVTRKKKAGEWHPHLHVVLDGNFVDQHLISKIWQQTTGDSMIVDIKSIRSYRESALHVSRYVARPMNLKDLSADERLELHSAFHGRRLVTTFGTARGLRLLRPPTVDRTKWRRVGAWSLVRDLAGTDERAYAILFAHESKTPLAPNITIYDWYNDQHGLPRDLEPIPPPLQGELTYD